MSISFTLNQVCEVSLLDSEFVSFQGDQTSEEDALMKAFLPSSTPAADEATGEKVENTGNPPDILTSVSSIHSH